MLPLTLAVRECQYQVTRPGFRVRTVTLVTTLLDADAYPAEERFSRPHVPLGRLTLVNH